MLLNSNLVGLNRPVLTSHYQVVWIFPAYGQAAATGSKNYTVCIVSVSKLGRGKQMISDNYKVLVATQSFVIRALRNYSNLRRRYPLCLLNFELATIKIAMQ